MNIIEAIKSGKRFRHPSFLEWAEYKCDRTIICEMSALVLDNWEIEEEKIEITRSQLEEAWNIFFSDPKALYPGSSIHKQMVLKEAFPLLANRLGFKS